MQPASRADLRMDVSTPALRSSKRPRPAGSPRLHYPKRPVPSWDQSSGGPSLARPVDLPTEPLPLIELQSPGTTAPDGLRSTPLGIESLEGVLPQGWSRTPKAGEQRDRRTVGRKEEPPDGHGKVAANRGIVLLHLVAGDAGKDGARPARLARSFRPPQVGFSRRRPGRNLAGA